MQDKGNSILLEKQSEWIYNKKLGTNNAAYVTVGHLIHILFKYELIVGDMHLNFKLEVKYTTEKNKV